MHRDRRRVHGQVKLEGEFQDVQGTCGVPVTLSRDGWRPESVDGLTPLEKGLLLDSAVSIHNSLSNVLDSAASNVRE